MDLCLKGLQAAMIIMCCRCNHEYLDVYSEVQQPEASELINSPFGGSSSIYTGHRNYCFLDLAVAHETYTYLTIVWGCMSRHLHVTLYADSKRPYEPVLLSRKCERDMKFYFTVAIIKFTRLVIAALMTVTYSF